MEKGKVESPPPQKSTEAAKSESPPRHELTEEEKLEWVETFQALDDMRRPDGLGAKMSRKINENPFVPIGMLATTAALAFGVYSMKSGNKKRSQLMMRTRVLAQGFTIGAILVGIAVSVGRTNKK